MMSVVIRIICGCHEILIMIVVFTTSAVSATVYYLFRHDDDGDRLYENRLGTNKIMKRRKFHRHLIRSDFGKKDLLFVIQPLSSLDKRIIYRRDRAYTITEIFAYIHSGGVVIMGFPHIHTHRPTDHPIDDNNCLVGKSESLVFTRRPPDDRAIRLGWRGRQKACSCIPHFYI